jgi:hypothetical protein
MDTLGVTFMDYLWEDLPVEHQHALEEFGLRAARYDTAKVLNLLLQHNGALLAYVSLPNLVHLGGVSFPTFRRSALFYRLRKALPSSLYILLRMATTQSYRSAAKGERQTRASMFQRREAIQRYFFLLLQGQPSEAELQTYLRGFPHDLQQEVILVGEQVRNIRQRKCLN